MSPEEALADPKAIRVRVLRSDPGGRWLAGSEGVLLENDFFDKYDAKVLLQPWHGPVDVSYWAENDRPYATEIQLVAGMDVFYFYNSEIERI